MFWVSENLGSLRYKQKLKQWQHCKHNATFYLSRLMTKPSKWHVRPVKTQVNLGIPPSLIRVFAVCINVHSEDSNQTGWMPRLIWVFTGCIFIFLVLSWGSSFASFLIKCRSKRLISKFFGLFIQINFTGLWNGQKVICTFFLKYRIIIRCR